MPLPARRAVLAPGEGRVHHPALGHESGVVAGIEREVSLGVADAVAEMGVGPPERAVERLGIRVEQQLVVVEAVAALGLVGPVDPVAVELARAHLGEVGVPDLVGVLGHHHARDLAVAGLVEQAQLHPLGVLGEQCEVDAHAVPGRPQGIGRAGPHADPVGVHLVASSPIRARILRQFPRAVTRRRVPRARGPAWRAAGA